MTNKNKKNILRIAQALHNCCKRIKKETNCRDCPQEFIIRVKMEKRWIPHFCSMLKYIEKLGKLGCSRKVAIFADGDGDFHPKFNFNIEFKEVPPVKEENGDRLYDAG